MAGATPLMPVTGYLYNSSYVSMGWPDGRSVQRSNCPSGLTPAVVLQAFVRRSFHSFAGGGAVPLTITGEL